MRLVLVRHGQAAPPSRDPARPLTPDGLAELERLARLLATARLGRVNEVWHSAKLRARQTAELLAETLWPDAQVLERAGLLPGDPIEPIAEALFAESGHIVVVGHLPLLGELASLLVCGRASADAFVFLPATLLGLERVPGARRFVVRYMLCPELLPPTS